MLGTCVRRQDSTRECVLLEAEGRTLWAPSTQYYQKYGARWDVHSPRVFPNAQLFSGGDRGAGGGYRTLDA